MKSISIIFSFFVINFSLLGQEKQSKIYVLFDYDKFELREDEQSKLDSLLSAQTFPLQKFELIGHTDSDGSNDYNLELSKNRVLTIQQYFLEKGITSSQIQTNFLGENVPIRENTNEAGKQRNRRVEIIFFQKEILQKPVEINPPIKEVQEDPIPIDSTKIEKPTLSGDTLLIVNGTHILISKKDFEKYKGCLKIKPILTGEDAIDANLSTITTDNDLLVSCGMVEITLKEPCEGCFDKPLKVRFPVSNPQCDVCRQRRVYNIAANGRWSEEPGRKIRKVRIDGQYFYEMIIECPSKKNCDCKQKPSRKIKFKLPRKYKFEKLNLTCDCPLMIYDFAVKKRKAKGGIPCIAKDRALFLYFEAIDANGNTFEGAKIPVKDLKHSIWKRCTKRFLGMGFWYFRKSKSKIYTKYKIDKSKLILNKNMTK